MVHWMTVSPRPISIFFLLACLKFKSTTKDDIAIEMKSVWGEGQGVDMHEELFFLPLYQSLQ